MRTPVLESLRFKARLAGLCYLLIIVCGLFSELFVRGQLVVPGDAALTASHIIASKTLYRWGIASEVLMVVCDVAVALLFYGILRRVNRDLALLAAFFRLIQAAILAVNLLHLYAAIALLGGQEYLNAFPPGQISALALYYTNLHTYGYLISGVFFGMSCSIVGYLFIKSGFFPKILGDLAILGGLSYLADSFTHFLFPGWAQYTEFMVLCCAVLAEVSLCLWLLLKGVRVERPDSLS